MTEPTKKSDAIEAIVTDATRLYETLSFSPRVNKEGHDALCMYLRSVLTKYRNNVLKESECEVLKSEVTMKHTQCITGETCDDCLGRANINIGINRAAGRIRALKQ